MKRLLLFSLAGSIAFSFAFSNIASAITRQEKVAKLQASMQEKIRSKLNPGAASPLPTLSPRPTATAGATAVRSRPSGSAPGWILGGGDPRPSLAPGGAVYRPTPTATPIPRPVPRPSVPGSTSPSALRPSSSYTVHSHRPVQPRPETYGPTIIARPTTTYNNTVIQQNSVNNYTYQQNTHYQGGYDHSQGHIHNPPRTTGATTRAYYPQLHYHWKPNCWTNSYRPAYYNYAYHSGTGKWLSVGGTTVVFANPFYTRPATPTVVAYDYSQPIRVPDPGYLETQDDLIRSERAIRRFDDAREVFRRGEYGRAHDLIEEAIRELPSDPTLHQFRALVLFARERYGESAATLYSVLAVSPGWDLATILKLYGDARPYDEDVRNLERHLAANPTAIEPRFLLAYHYLVRGENAAARRQLELLRTARPADRLIESLYDLSGG